MPARVAAIAEIVLVLGVAAVLVRTLGARVGLIALLIATCLIDRFTYSLGPIGLRTEQVAALAGLGMVAYLIATGERGILKPSLSEALLGVWFLISLISSVTAAPDVSRSMKGTALLVVASLGFLLSRRLIDKTKDREQIDLIVKIFLLAIAAEGAYGSLAWLLYGFGNHVSISPNPVTGHLSAYGTLWEPNVFGAFCAAGAIAWTWLGHRYFRFAWIGIAACLAGTLVSFTRAAWGVVIVVLALTFIGRARRRIHLRQLAFGIAATAVFAMASFAAEHVSDYYVPVSGQPPPSQARGLFALLVNAVDVIGRLDQIRIGGGDITSHLVLGNGTASFGERHMHDGQPEHLTNLELTVLYDTGIVGVLVFLEFAASIAYAAWRRRDDPFVAGLGMAILVIAMTNLATETSELMITWLLLGLLAMAIDAASRTDSLPSPPMTAHTDRGSGW